MYRQRDDIVVYKGYKVNLKNIDFLKKAKNYILKNKLYYEIDNRNIDFRSLSYKVYGTVQFDWLLYLINDIYDIYKSHLFVKKIKVPEKNVINDLLKI